MYPYYFMFLKTLLGKAAREGPTNLYVKRAYKCLSWFCAYSALLRAPACDINCCILDSLASYTPAALARCHTFSLLAAQHQKPPIGCMQSK